MHNKGRVVVATLVILNGVCASVLSVAPHDSSSQGVINYFTDDIIRMMLSSWGIVAGLSLGLIVFWIVYSVCRKQNIRAGIEQPQSRSMSHL
jgi:hypothetical protein